MKSSLILPIGSCIVLVTLGAVLMFLGSSFWFPASFGEEVYWDMQSGKLQSRTLLAGVVVRVHEESSGVEMLFSGSSERPWSSPKLTYRRSLLQPRRGVADSARLLYICQLICKSPRFERTANRDDVQKLKRWIISGNSQELSGYLKTLYAEPVTGSVN